MENVIQLITKEWAEFRKNNFDPPTTLYLGREHYDALRGAPGKELWQYYAMDFKGEFAEERMLGMQIYVVSNDRKHLKVLA